MHCAGKQNGREAACALSDRVESLSRNEFAQPCCIIMQPIASLRVLRCLPHPHQDCSQNLFSLHIILLVAEFLGMVFEVGR